MDWTLTLEALASVMTTAQALDQERPEHPKIWHIKCESQTESKVQKCNFLSNQLLTALLTALIICMIICMIF